jgi:hypothetical protein
MYVARHPMFARCRVEGHWWQTALRCDRDGVHGLQKGVTVIAQCQRCGTTKTHQFDGVSRYVRRSRHRYPEGWNEFSINLVADYILRDEVFATLPVLAHSSISSP